MFLEACGSFCKVFSMILKLLRLLNVFRGLWQLLENFKYYLDGFWHSYLTLEASGRFSGQFRSFWQFKICSRGFWKLLEGF